jgi:hypothetical protein
MGSRYAPEIPCIVCKKPVNLQTDLCADENGKAVHADCYVSRITKEIPAVPHNSTIFGNTWQTATSLSLL